VVVTFDVLEADRLHDHVAGETLPFEGLHEPLGWRDLAVDAAEALLGAVRLAMHEAPFSAHAHVHLIDRRGHPSRTPPARDQLRVGVHREHALAGRVEHALAHDLALDGGGDRGLA
jgi:hypothetical protein